MKKRIKQISETIYSTMPARIREGAAYPGGKILRKAHARLANRRQGMPQKQGYRMPGSMTK